MLLSECVLRCIFEYNVPFLSNIFRQRCVFLEAVQNLGLSGTNTLETRDFVSLKALLSKYQGKLSPPTLKSAPYPLMTTLDQQQLEIQV
jgi:hypothetical protein